MKLEVDVEMVIKESKRNEDKMERPIEAPLTAERVMAELRTSNVIMRELK